MKAFTLAEILITLLVVSIVASLVIPALINDTQKAEYVTKLKKESAVLQQTFKLIALDSGGSILNNPNFNCSGSFCDNTASANAMNEFAAKLNVIKNCGISTGCLHNYPVKFLGSGNDIDDFDTYYVNRNGKAILADGTMMKIRIYNTSCNTNKSSTPVGSPLYYAICGSLWIDINGTSQPNKLGRDIFIFWITKTGIYPLGTYKDGYQCVIDSHTESSSYGCTEKVLSEGAMNY